MGTGRAKILVVDDEPIKRSILEDGLSAAGHDVVTAGNPLEAQSYLDATHFNVIVTDLRMPGQDGLTFLRELKRQRPELSVIVVTAYGTVETAVEAMKLGAFDYIQKPFATEELLLKIDKILKYEHLASENEALRRQLSVVGTEPIMGRSTVMRELLAQIHVLADTDATVLIEGESGTGKELVARTLHETSPRARGPFVAVACAALPRELIESELFGHEPGAFTGAGKLRIGRFELAHGGTIFLDDVDDIPLDVQVKLLRVLQEKTIERVGSSQLLHVNIRIIAATKKSLAAMVAAGKFREDLFYRLSVVPLHTPPLRERASDIPLLVDHFLRKLEVQMNRPELSISAAAMKRLESHLWPGNVRELEHLLERMVALSGKDKLEERDIPALSVNSGHDSLISLSLEHEERVDMAAILAETESRLLRWAMEKSGGNLAAAAEMLRIPRSTLQYKLSKSDHVDLSPMI